MLMTPNPDVAAETVGDRMQLAFAYPGIASGAAATFLAYRHMYPGRVGTRRPLLMHRPRHAASMILLFLQAWW